MNLKPREYELICKHMLSFRIIYHEVYIELLDHVTSDIEHKRRNGDLRDAAVLLDEVITQMGGKQGIEKMAQEHANLFRVKIVDRIKNISKKNLIWKLLGAAAFCTLADRLIPNNKISTGIVYLIIILVIFAVIMFINYRMGALRPTDNKKSLLRVSIFWQAWLPMAMLNVAFIIENIIRQAGHQRRQPFLLIHPTIPLIIFCYTMLYLRNCYLVMQQEILTAHSQ